MYSSDIKFTMEFLMIIHLVFIIFSLLRMNLVEVFLSFITVAIVSKLQESLLVL